MRDEALQSAIDYIYDNFKYGKDIVWRDLEEVLRKYDVKDKDQKTIYQELNNLEISVFFPSSVIRPALSRLICSCKNSSKTISTKQFDYWIDSEKIYDKSLQLHVLKILEKHDIHIQDTDTLQVVKNSMHENPSNIGQTIIEETLDNTKSQSMDFFDVAPEDVESQPYSSNNSPKLNKVLHKNVSADTYIDFDNLGDGDLDEVLDSEEFQAYKSTLEIPADKSNNLALIAEYQQTDTERQEKDLNKLVQANERLVYSIVRLYMRFTTSSCTEDDLFQAGCVGLIIAIRKFDFSKETQLSTYATWWIRQSIQRTIDKESTTVRIPVHTRELQRKILKTSHELIPKLGREPTTYEIAEAIKLPEDKVQLLIDTIPLSNLVSLDTPVGEEGELPLKNLLTTREESEWQTPVALANIDNQDVQDSLRDLLGVLMPRERSILTLRFGLSGNPPMTLQEISDAFSLTRERVRQLVEQSLSQIRDMIKDPSTYQLEELQG